jgi:hypothetical protein
MSTKKPAKKPRYTAATVVRRVEALLTKEGYNSDFNGACLDVIRMALKLPVGA